VSDFLLNQDESEASDGVMAPFAGEKVMINHTTELGLTVLRPTRDFTENMCHHCRVIHPTITNTFGTRKGIVRHYDHRKQGTTLFCHCDFGCV
jgi:hypothetical protein